MEDGAVKARVCYVMRIVNKREQSQFGNAATSPIDAVHHPNAVTVGQLAQEALAFISSTKQCFENWYHSDGSKIGKGWHKSNKP